MWIIKIILIIPDRQDVLREYISIKTGRRYSQARGNKFIEILDRDRAIKGRLLMIVFYNPQ